MNETKKEAKEKKFMLDLFANKKAKHWIPGNIEALNRDLTLRQKRAIKMNKLIPSTANNQYQIYKSYRKSMADEGHDSSTRFKGRSTGQSSYVNAMHNLDSILVGGSHLG